MIDLNDLLLFLNFVFFLLLFLCVCKTAFVCLYHEYVKYVYVCSIILCPSSMVPI